MTHFSTPLRDIPKTDFSQLERYWNDPEFARRMDAEHARQRQLNNGKMTAGIAKYRAKQLNEEWNG